MRDKEIITNDELVVKAEYLNCMQDNTNCYWKQSIQHNNIIVPTCAILQPCVNVTTLAKERKYQNVFAIKTKHARLCKGFQYF